MNVEDNLDTLILHCTLCLLGSQLKIEEIMFMEQVEKMVGKVYRNFIFFCFSPFCVWFNYILRKLFMSVKNNLFFPPNFNFLHFFWKINFPNKMSFWENILNLNLGSVFLIGKVYPLKNLEKSNLQCWVSISGVMKITIFEWYENRCKILKK